MTHTLQLKDRDVRIEIKAKNNKNTYFRFQPDGTILVTKSKYQTSKYVLGYIKDNEDYFYDKVMRNYRPLNESTYQYFGQDYMIAYHSKKEVFLDIEKTIIYLPNKSIDPDAKVLAKFEQNTIISLGYDLCDKYKHNGLISLDDLHIKSGHTKTRFGSCHIKKRVIRLNAHLIHYPRQYLEYVFLHEITHLKVANHSKDFYRLFEQLCPNYKVLRKELKRIYR